MKRPLFLLALIPLGLWGIFALPDILAANPAGFWDWRKSLIILSGLLAVCWMSAGMLLAARPPNPLIGRFSRSAKSRRNRHKSILIDQPAKSFVQAQGFIPFHPSGVKVMKTFKPSRNIFFAAIIAAMMLPLQASAQTASTRGPLPFSAYDQNGDGSVSAEEFKAVREQRQAAGRPMRNAPSFADLDSNHDGKLSAEEFAARQNSTMGRGQGAGAGAGPGTMPTFADFDLNKDGKISADEFSEARTARISQRATEGRQMRGLANAPAFAEIDTNHDGTLSPQEFSDSLNQHRQQM